MRQVVAAAQRGYVALLEGRVAYTCDKVCLAVIGRDIRDDDVAGICTALVLSDFDRTVRFGKHIVE